MTASGRIVRGADEIKEFRVFYIFMLFVLAVMCFAYIGRLAPLLFIVLAAAPLVSLALLIVTFISVSFSQTPVEIVIEKKQECAVKIHIKNKFALPIIPIVIKGVFFNDSDSELEQRTIIAELKPFSEVTIDIPLIAKFRGEYEIGIDSYEIYDMFRLFCLKKRLKERTSVLVLPRRIEIDALRDFSETEADNSHGSLNNINKNTFSSFREYRPGDKIQHIHWKLTSKHNEFIVKQMEQTISSTAIVFCDFTAGGDKSTIDYHVMSDAVIETALAIAKKNADEGNSTTICFKNPDTLADELVEINDENVYRKLFYDFALMTYKPVLGVFGDLIQRFGDETDTQKTIYLLTNKVDLDFIRCLDENGFSTRKDTILVLFKTTEHEKSHLDYIANETGITLKLADPDNIAATLSEI